MNVYADEDGYVYAAEEPDHHSHQTRTEVSTYAEARRFVRETFDVLIANSREWIVRQGHPGVEDDE